MKLCGEVNAKPGTRAGGETGSGSRRRFRCRWRVAAPLALLPTLILVSCGGDGSGEIQASGTVEAREADLGFQMAGRVAWIGPQEGDELQAGAEVARLDMAELEARKEAAQAQLVAAEALLAEMTAGFRPGEVAEGQAALRGAHERLADAIRDRDRAQRLFEGGAVSREMLDKAETAARVAQSAVDQATERVGILEEGPRRERVAAQRAMVTQAEAAVAQIDATLANGHVLVPFPGIVTVRHREPGETVSPGMPVLTVMDPQDRWVRIYVREDRVGEVQLGQTATITSDTYPERSYRGEVFFIASEAEFTPRNVQTPEERVKLVYAVKVRIVDDDANDLKAGIPADVVLAGTGTSGV